MYNAVYKSIYGTNLTDRSVMTSDELEHMDKLCEEADNDRSALLERKTVSIIARLAMELGAARQELAQVRKHSGWRPQEGWVMVPREPTEAMIEAGGIGSLSTDNPIVSIYEAMLAAAPVSEEGK